MEMGQERRERASNNSVTATAIHVRLPTAPLIAV
jgi:hypothetical protein